MKTRFTIWIGLLVLVVAFVLDNISLTLPKIPHKEKISLYIDLNEKYIKSKAYNYDYTYRTNTFGGYEMSFTTNKENASIVLTSKDVETLTGYSEMNLAYSPMILMTYNGCSNNNHLFNQQEMGEKFSGYVFVNFKTILNAIENNKTWVDLECFVNDKNIANEKVTLTVANLDTKEGLYAWNTIYQELKEMYPSLNQIDLEKRTNNIFNKCNKSDNILLELKNMTEDDMNNFYLVPEYIITNGINLNCVYFESDKAINFKVFFKNEMKNDENINEKISLLLMKSLYIRTTDDFPYKYGNDFYRMKRIVDYVPLNENIINPVYSDFLETKVIDTNKNIQTSMVKVSKKEESKLVNTKNIETIKEKENLEKTISENIINENSIDKKNDNSISIFEIIACFFIVFALFLLAIFAPILISFISLE